MTTHCRVLLKLMSGTVDCVCDGTCADFVFRRNGRAHLNRRGGASVQSTTGSRGVRISDSNAGYIMFRGSVKSNGYPLHSPVSPFASLPERHRVSSCFDWPLPLLPLYSFLSWTGNRPFFCSFMDGRCIGKTRFLASLLSGLGS